MILSKVPYPFQYPKNMGKHVNITVINKCWNSFSSQMHFCTCLSRLFITHMPATTGVVVTVCWEELPLHSPCHVCPSLVLMALPKFFIFRPRPLCESRESSLSKSNNLDMNKSETKHTHAEVIFHSICTFTNNMTLVKQHCQIDKK